MKRGSVLKPVIGITSSIAKLSELSQGVYVHQDYFRGIEACGGLPIVLPLTSSETFLELLSLCDGVIFSGGEDVDPKFYGEEPHQNLGNVFALRDEVEIAGIKRTLESKKPLLAICRGVQVLNVACGGVLYQDIPSEMPNSLQHSQKSARGADSHWVELTEESKLYRIFREQKIRVNSHHHQAVLAPGQGLSVVARASDGVIEALEGQEDGFVVGVQWHPESMWEHDTNMKKLFEAFVNECKNK
jgi:putative glutamine amidotransferase